MAAKAKAGRCCDRCFDCCFDCFDCEEMAAGRVEE